IIAVTCDNALANTAMLDELEEQLVGFLGKRAHVRCFAHTVNLTAKGVLCPFEPVKRKAATNEENNEEAGEHRTRTPEEQMGLDELYTELMNLEENGDVDRDNIEGFVEVLNEMSEEEREEWDRNVAPVKSTLYKVSWHRVHGLCACRV
ncbi:hypothetical protein C8R42DRAFT_592237, partial [Lentinula raphanica]